MSLVKPTGARVQVLLCVLVGLLVWCGPVSQAAELPEDELAALKLRFDSLRDRYRLLCEMFSELAANLSAPGLNCSECPDGWFQVEDQCFQIKTDRQDWLTSAQACMQEGGHLAILKGLAHHDAVEKESRRVSTFYTSYWIGLTDIEKEGEWKWVDNSTMENPFWDALTPEPDNNTSGGPEGEDCAVVDGRSQRWNDVPCSFKYPRICQKAAIPLP